MRVLIFGTSYVETFAQVAQVINWRTLHVNLNRKCDLLLVDSASPMIHCFESDGNVLQLGDNIGHLGRGGQDGWGRAFCWGIEYAIDKGYDYVAHIESDSLFRLSVMPICEQMQRDSIRAASVEVNGTKHVESGWVETGLMIFDVGYLRKKCVTDQYDWRDGSTKSYPHTPEWHLAKILGDALQIMPWRAVRDDKRELTIANVVEYDWITHTSPEIFDAFVRNKMVS